MLKKMGNQELFQLMAIFKYRLRLYSATIWPKIPFRVYRYIGGLKSTALGKYEITYIVFSVRNSFSLPTVGY